MSDAGDGIVQRFFDAMATIDRITPQSDWMFAIGIGAWDALIADRLRQEDEFDLSMGITARSPSLRESLHRLDPDSTERIRVFGLRLIVDRSLPADAVTIRGTSEAMTYRWVDYWISGL